MAESINPQEQALREMLPDYLNGHAPADVASRIAARLEHDPHWAADAGWLGEIRTAIEAEAAGMDPAAGLAQLHRRLERPGFWRRCYQRLALPALAPVAITALASLCIGQAWLLWQQAAPADQLRWRSVPGAVAPPASLRVQFLPTASMAQVAAALEQAQAGIVAGPLPEHGYLLDAADPPTALQSLRASGVVAAASLASTPGAP